MEPSEKVVEKIEQGAFSNLPQLKYTDSQKKRKSKKVEPSAKNGLTAAGKEEIKEIVKASNAEINGSTKPNEAKAPNKPNAPPQIKVANLPVKAHINQYGFIGLGKSELRALGLTVVDTPKAKEKLSADVPIELSSYDSASKILTIKIL